MKMQKILVGIDGSEGSYRAAAVAADFAAAVKASVTLIFVATGQEAERYMAKPTYVSADEVFSGERLVRGKEIVEERGVPLETVVEMGDPAEKILERAGEGYGLIVVGTRGLSAVRELILGSVTSRVIRSSTVPVMVVP